MRAPGRTQRYKAISVIIRTGGIASFAGGPSGRDAFVDRNTGLKPCAWSLALTSDFKRVLIALVSSYWTSYMSQAWVT